MKKHIGESDDFVLKINCKDHVLIRKSPECRFYYDDVFVEVIADKRYIIAEDSYEYGVYPELSGALTQIKTAAVNDVVASIGAPGDKGGLLLLFKKLDDTNIALYIKTPRKKNGVLRYDPYFGVAEMELHFGDFIFEKNVSIKYVDAGDGLEPCLHEYIR